MHRQVLPLLLVGLLVLSSAVPAAAQDRTRESRDVASFTEVGFSVPGTLHLRQGDSRAVEVEASRAVLDNLETTVEGDRLEIRDDENFFEQMFDSSEDGPVDVYVTAPTLETISLAGSGTVTGETSVEAKSLALDNAGSGTIDLGVDTGPLRIGIAGSGTVRLRGTADEATVQIAGSGTVEAEEVTTSTAEVEVAGSGDTALHVTDRLSVQIMGSGDVVYRGSPTLDTSILGSGEVRSVEQ